MCAPTTVAVLVCPPMRVGGAHHKVPNSGARYQEGTEQMSPKTQSTLPIVVEWAKGMLHPQDGDRHPQKPQGVENNIIGCITRLLPRPSRLHQRIATTTYRRPFPLKFLQPCKVDLDKISSSAPHSCRVSSCAMCFYNDV